MGLEQEFQEWRKSREPSAKNGPLSKLPVLTQARLGEDMEAGPPLKHQPKPTPKLVDVEDELKEVPVPVVSPKERKKIVEGHEKGKPELVVVGSLARTPKSAKALADIQSAMLSEAQRKHLEAEEAEAQSKESKERLETLAYNEPRWKRGMLKPSEAQVESELRKHESRIKEIERKEALEAKEKAHPSPRQKVKRKVKEFVAGKPQPSTTPAPPSVAPSQPTERVPKGRAKSHVDMLVRVAGMEHKDLNSIIERGEHPSEFIPFGRTKQDIEQRKLSDQMILNEIKRAKINQLEDVVARKIDDAARYNSYKRFKL
jgi:hypothetical protein